MISIAIGSDHAGFELKEIIAGHLRAKGYKIKDYGTTCGNTSVDYPDFGIAVARAVSSENCDKGIIICGSGIGISIAANKIPGIRAALCTNSFMAKVSREHNDANILAIGSRVVGSGLALDIVDTWLESDFLGGRHKVRVDKITNIERF